MCKGRISTLEAAACFLGSNLCSNQMVPRKDPCALELIPCLTLLWGGGTQPATGHLADVLIRSPEGRDSADSLPDSILEPLSLLLSLTNSCEVTVGANGVIFLSLKFSI